MNEKLEKLYKTLNGGERTYFEFIENLVVQEDPKDILEIGSGWGLSAIAFLVGSGAKLVTIDKQGLESLKLFKERIDLFDLWGRIVMLKGESTEILQEIPRSEALDKQFDIVYVDGDHGYEGAKRDIELAWPKLKEGGIMFLDDMAHYLNFITRDKEATKGEPEFGVSRAMLEWAMANEKKFDFYPVCNGFAVLRK